MPKRKLLVVEVASLGYDFLTRQVGSKLGGLEFKPLESVFPALVCPVQASFRTALAPAGHGMVANGFYDRTLGRVLLGEQSASLIEGPRIWEGFRRRGKRVGMLFWQQSLGEDVEVLLASTPVHKHSGRMIPHCYGRPDDLYSRLCTAVGREFSLVDYRGPTASTRCGDWIASASAALLSDHELAPELCLVYLPTLDYDLQRSGPGGDRGLRALEALAGQMKLLLDAASINDYDLIVFGDYAPVAVTSDAVFPNRALAQAGLLETQRAGHMLYAEFHHSRAFAVVDHEIAHVAVRRPKDVESVRTCLRQLDGIAEVLDREAQAALGLDHPRSGELVIIAEEGRWLAYPWWRKKREAPDYAKHMNVRNKPGVDPCELFFGRFPTQISTDTSQVKGTHGRAGAERPACWAATCSLGAEPKTLLELAAAVRSRLDDG